MATATVNVAGIFPDGTSVGAYVTATQPSDSRAAPSGSSVATATVSGDSLTFTGLTEDASYLAIAQVSGAWRRHGFIVNELPAGKFVDGVEIATQAALDSEAESRADADSALDTRTDVIEARVLNEFINVKNAPYGCAGDGTTDDTTAWLAAHTAAKAATGSGGKLVAPPGTYLLDGEIPFDQYVAFEGAGARECILKLNDASSQLLFNEHGGATNSRGGRVSGFQVNGNALATTCMEVQVAVNRSFSDFRIISPGANGIGLLVRGAQNSNFHDFDIECNTAANTTALKVTDSAGSCRFDHYSILEAGYAGIWVTQDNSGGQYGIGYPEPRYCAFDNGIIEHGDPTTACAVRIHSGRDLWFTRQALFVATDQPSDGPYTIVEINDAGAGTTSFNVFDMGSVSGGADPQKDSTAFDIQAGSDTYRTRIANYSFGNNTFGVVAASGQTVEVDNYRGPSTDTMFSGAGTIISRTFGATTYT